MLRTLALIPAMLFAMWCLAVPAQTLAAAAETEDVIYMNDGRVLHGNILGEDDDVITFELIDRKYNLRTPLKLNREDIADIRRDVSIAGSGDETDQEPSSASRAVVAPVSATAAAGANAAEPVDMSLPGIYVVDMKGQMGTDINKDAYLAVVEDIKAQKPALIVIEMECRDRDDLMINMVPTAERGLMDFEAFWTIIDQFKDDLRAYPQVLWIKDSVGFSSLMAMAWPDMYMSRAARLTGLRGVIASASRWQDTDVRAKMMAAITGRAKGILENGGYPAELGEAMMIPEKTLAASFKGRKVVWHLDGEGEYDVDTDKEETIGFDARTAENLTLSEGTVDELDDLLFLCGFREYRLIETPARDSVKKYIEDWRRTFDDTKVWWQDYQQFLGWANGADAIKYLGQAKSRLNQIINAMRRYKAVEIRWQMEMGAGLQQLIVQEEQLTEQIRGLKQGGGGDGGGGGRGGGGRGDPGRGR